jgi:hypothetical protein
VGRREQPVTYIPDAEYAAIKQSWKHALKNPERWSNGQMASASLVNVEEAAKREGRLRRLYDTMPPGDPRLVGDKDNPSLREQIRTAVSDQTHWRYQAAYWRGRCVTEGPDALPPTKFVVDAGKPKRVSYIDDPRLNGDPIVRAERDLRLPREPGDDDEEVSS